MPAVGAFISGVWAGFTGGGAVLVGAGAANAGAAALGVAIGSSAIGKMVIGLAISLGLSAALIKKPSLGEPIGAPMDLGMRSDSVKRFVYGETAIGGDYVYATTSRKYYYQSGRDASTNFDEILAGYEFTGSETDLLHTVIEVAGHPVESFEEFRLDGEQVFLEQVAPTGVLISGESDLLTADPDLDVDFNGVPRYTPIESDKNADRLILKLYPQGATVADSDLIAASSFLDFDPYFALGGFNEGTGSGRSQRGGRKTTNPEYSTLIRSYFDGGKGATVGIETDFYNKVSPSVLSEHYFQFDDAIDTASTKARLSLRMRFGSPRGDRTNEWNSGDVLGVRVELGDGTLVVEDTTFYTVPSGGVDEDEGVKEFVDVEIPSLTSSDLKVFVLLGGNKTFSTSNTRAFVYPEAIKVERLASNLQWGSTNIGKGKAWYYARWKFDPETFSGFPRPSIKIKGKNDIRDPRCDVVFTANEATETFTATGHGMSNGDVIQVTTDGSLPTELATGTDYYVINKTDNTFQLSETRGGSVKTISTNGTGTHTVDHQGGYRDNVALCIADYMTTPKNMGGYGVPWSKINISILIESANICDESIVIHDDGTTQPRYFIGGSFTTDSNPADILKQMASTMAGWVEEIDGLWYIEAGQYKTPSMTITENEFRDVVSTVLDKPMRESFNSVRVVTRTKESDFQPTPDESVEALDKFDVTPNHTTETFTKVDHGKDNGDRVRFISWDGTAIDNDNLPDGIDQSAWYYIVNKTDDTFQVSLEKGGTVVTFGDNGTGTIRAFHDIYLSRDSERRVFDTEMPLVNDSTLSRRLGLIQLKKARQGTSAVLPLKLGTPDACCFDLRTGDTIRWVDNHKSFWEYTGTAVNAGTDSGGTITKVAHGLQNGDPLVITDSDDTGWTEAFPYYVINRTDDTFQIANYRGGSALTTDSSYPLQYRTIQGKLFVVDEWELVSQDGLTLGVDVRVTSTANDIYTWNNDNEVAPPDSPGISVGSPRQVETPTGLTAESGTDQLYINADGTVTSRVRLSWDAPQSRFITSGGRAIIMQRESLEWRTFTVDTSEDCFIDTAHGITGGWIIVNIGGSNTLPSGLDKEYYWVASVTADRFLIAEFPGGPFVDITSAGTGTHEYAPLLEWNDVATVSGGSNEYFILDVEDGKTYDFGVRYANSIGREGWFTETARHTVVGKTAAPGAPTGVSATSLDTYGSNQITVSWTNPTDLDLDRVEVWAHDSTTSDPESDGTLVGSSKGDSILYFHDKPQETVYFYARAVDTTGNSSSFASVASATSGFTPKAKNIIFNNTSLGVSFNGEVDSTKRIGYNLAIGESLPYAIRMTYSATNSGASNETIFYEIRTYDNTGSLVFNNSFASSVNAGTTKYVEDIKNITAGGSGASSAISGYTIRLHVTTKPNTTMQIENAEIIAEVRS